MLSFLRKTTICLHQSKRMTHSENFFVAPVFSRSFFFARCEIPFLTYIIGVSRSDWLVLKLNCNRCKPPSCRAKIARNNNKNKNSIQWHSNSSSSTTTTNISCKVQKKRSKSNSSSSQIERKTQQHRRSTITIIIKWKMKNESKKRKQFRKNQKQNKKKTPNPHEMNHHRRRHGTLVDINLQRLCFVWCA